MRRGKHRSTYYMIAHMWKRERKEKKRRSFTYTQEGVVRCLMQFLYSI